MSRALETDPINQLEENLQCSVCLEALTDPRTLPCCHSFCKDCLEGVVKTCRDKAARDGGQIREFPCPDCRAMFTLEPDKHVADMPRNHFICNMVQVTAVLDRGTRVPCSHNCSQSSVARCVTCEKFLCRECLTDHNKYRGHNDHSVLTMEELSKPENQAKIKGKMYCNEHSGKTLKIYCETCDQLICKHCMDFKHVKQNHSCLLVKDVASSYKELLASNNKAMEDALIEGNNFLHRLSQKTTGLDSDVENAKRHIVQRKELMTKKVVGMLNQKAETLLKEVEGIHKSERTKLDSQTTETKLYVENIKQSVQLSKKLVDQGTEEEIISSQKMMLENANNLLKKRSEYFREKITVTKVRYIPGTNKEPLDDDNVETIENNLGRIIVGDDIGSNQAENKHGQRNTSMVFSSTAFSQPASSLTPGFHQPAPSKQPDETLSVNSLFLRYTLAYHYEVFEKLESVSKEISFEEKKECKKDLKITAREEVDRKKFSKIVDEFIDFYQDKHQKMHQENVHTKSGIDMAVISETRLKFSVVIDSTTESDKLTIYGEKDKVLEAKRFLQSKPAGSGADNDSSKGTTGKETAAKGATTKGATGKGELVEKISCEVAKNVKLVVYQGDITKEEVDAIVNPANDRLQHGGGAALAILKAGGKSIQDDCDTIMKKRSYRPLKTGEVQITSGGKLPCKFVVHAVGPVWNSFAPNSSSPLLYNAVYNSLYWACCYGVRSISIPAISSGLYKVPVDICARVLFDAVTNFTSAADKSLPLKEVRFVNIDQLTNRTFSQEIEKRFGSSIKREKVEAHLPTNSKRQEKEMRNQQSQTLFWVSNPGSSQRPGSGQPVNAIYQGSHTHGSGDDTSKGRNHSSSQPPKPLLSYSEAAAGKKTVTSDPKPGTDDEASKDDECCICLFGFTNKKTLKCGHSFCSECIKGAFKVKKQCPICSTVYGPLTGDQPDGRMYDSFQSTSLPGFPSCGTIVISYRFLNGTQGSNHPKPGKPYYGTSRTAYLPYNDEGRKVLRLLKKAFDQKLTFTIGRSTTTGREDVVTWNDIHHKTSEYGGPSGYGYPDPDYLKRVQEELAAKGITE